MSSVGKGGYPKASQERIAALRRKLSNQANGIHPEPEVPGAPHTAQASGHFSAGNPDNEVPDTLVVEESQALPEPTVGSAAPTRLYQSFPVATHQPEDSQASWPPVGRYNFNETPSPKPDLVQPPTTSPPTATSPSPVPPAPPVAPEPAPPVPPNPEPAPPVAPNPEPAVATAEPLLVVPNAAPSPGVLSPQLPSNPGPAAPNVAHSPQAAAKPIPPQRVAPELPASHSDLSVDVDDSVSMAVASSSADDAGKKDPSYWKLLNSKLCSK